MKLYAQRMRNEQNLLGHQSRSAAAVRTAAVLVLLGIALVIVGAATALTGVMILGAICVAAAIVCGIIGMATAR